METNKTTTAPSPPRVVKTLVAGFDAITNHIALILFPVGLDLIIWLAPHLRLKNLIQAWMEVVFQPVAEMPDVAEMMGAAEEIWTLMAERFNILITLRSYPVGVPSLIATTLPLEIPGGRADMVEISSVGNALLLAGGLTFFGLIVGSLYFALVGRAAVSDEVRLVARLAEWPQRTAQVILLGFVWLGLFVGVSVPVSCGISIFALTGLPVGPVAVLVIGTLLLWIIFPLLFSPHGIFIKYDNAWASIKRSIQITRLTLPTTATFFLVVVLLSQALDTLWRIPPENSWLMLLGIFGHAFVATGLLSASFIYYQQADEWVQALLEKTA
jgi:hypothetical protein